MMWSGFLRSAERWPDRPALVAAGATLSYAQLREQAMAIAATLQACDVVGDPPLSAVLAYRSPTAFAGILGALLAGNGYVPLNPHFPYERTQLMLENAGCRSIIVDAQ